MKKVVLLVAICCSLSLVARALDASVTFATFTAPNQPYVELYLYIHGSTIEQKMTMDSLFQSNVEVVTIFRQGDLVIKVDKYLLNSPLGKKNTSLYDLRRYGLANGSYDLEVTIKDVNKETNKNIYRTKIEINYEGEGLLQSDIELLSSAVPDNDANKLAVKNGYFMEALPFNFYNRSLPTLYFYNEIYNSDKAIGDDFMIRYFIELVNGNETTETMIIAHKKKKASPINVLLHQVDISKLPSGNFNLVVEVRDRAGELLSSKTVFFQRSNPYLDLEIAQEAPLEEEFVADLTKEELRYSLKAIAPLVKGSEVEVLNYVIDNVEDLEAQRRYLFTFWSIESPVDTKTTYEKYMNVARAVDKTYQSGFGYGFETDRGFRFMKYGKPNDIRTITNDPSAPPYEIWVYETFPTQNRAKFIFYNPSLSPGDYILLHSTAIGELNNPQWELELYRDVPNELDGDDFVSGTDMQDNIYRQAKRLFEDL